MGHRLLRSAFVAIPAALLAALAAPAAAQLPPAAIEKHIAAIPAAQRAIDAWLKTFEKRAGRYTNAGGEVSVTGYYEGPRLRKLAVNFDGDGASWAERYYFDGDELFFATLRWQTYATHPGQKETVSEARYDFGYGTLLRWRKRGYAAGASQRPPFAPETDQVRIANKQEDLIGRAGRYGRFLASGGKDLPE